MKHNFYFTQVTLAARYGVTARTIQRWKNSGKLPPPDELPSGRKAWGDTTIEEHERSRVGGGEAA